MKHYKVTDLENNNTFFQQAEDLEKAQTNLAWQDWSDEAKFEWFDSQRIFTYDRYFMEIHKYYKIEEVDISEILA